MPRPKSPRGALALRLARLRDLHVYVSAFVAPSLIFFAATGALQTFRLPDKPQAPPVIAKLARLHKDDVFAMKPARPRGRSERAGPPKAAPAPRPATEALKWFFAAASIGMIVTTAFGIWMALAYHKRRALLGMILLAGAAIPALLAAL